jgi:hypothetical protein
VRHLIGRLGRWVLLASCLLAAPLWAEVPDPITFGYAVERGDLRRVKGWLDEGLSPEYEAAHIGTGLMVAAWYGNIEMMALFVERGADLRRSNRNGEQALQLAAWGGHLEAVKWLIERGAPLEREDKQWGALHYAVFNGHEKVVSDLMARGANVNARAPNGATPLMLAAREGHERLARVLLEAGANTRSQSDWGDTALTMAMRYNHLRLAKMISSPEEFAIAVKAPPESFGEATRSAVAPSPIEAILREIRAAEAEGRPSEELHRKLRVAVNDLRRPTRCRWRSARCHARMCRGRWSSPPVVRSPVPSGRRWWSTAALPRPLSRRKAPAARLPQPGRHRTRSPLPKSAAKRQPGRRTC